MKTTFKALTIKEKKELLLNGKDIPVCVFENSRAESERKKQKEKLDKKFAKNVL